jgi:hypothetical protein
MAMVSSAHVGLFEALMAAGLADKTTRRVVIDINTNEPVMIYTERYGDERVIEVVQTLSGIEVTYASPEEEEGVVDHG